LVASFRFIYYRDEDVVSLYVFRAPLHHDSLKSDSDLSH
jgi:hypothetical protein